jgi:hypothetical protein
MLLLTGGVSGLAYQALLLYRRVVDQRLRAAAAARRAIVRGERRKRAQIQRLQQSSERERAAAAELRRRDLRAHDRLESAAAELLEAESRNVREAELEDQVLRLELQSHSELTSGVSSVFSKRHWNVSVPDSEAPFDLLLLRDQEDQEPLRCVARCVPPERIAELTDLDALDAWRERESAAHGYLISVRGFDERAVQMLRLRSMSITLVEAHLLALWANLKSNESVE